MAEQNQNQKGNEKKQKQGRKIKDINQRKSVKIYENGNTYIPICVYVRKDLIQKIDEKKNLGWSRRQIIEKGILSMIEKIEQVQRETIKRVQAEENNIKERIL